MTSISVKNGKSIQSNYFFCPPFLRSVNFPPHLQYFEKNKKLREIRKKLLIYGGFQGEILVGGLLAFEVYFFTLEKRMVRQKPKLHGK